MKKLKSVLMLSVIMTLTAPAMAQSVPSAPKPGVVSGKVSFERREGIVPNTMNPAPYWGVVVRDHGVTYELAHVAGMDDAARPSSVKIQGRVVHEGDQVSIEGMIHKVRNDLGLVSETMVKSVQ